VSGQLHDAAALPPGKEPPVPTGQEAGWAPELFCYTMHLLQPVKCKHYIIFQCSSLQNDTFSLLPA